MEIIFDNAPDSLQHRQRHNGPCLCASNIFWTEEQQAPKVGKGGKLHRVREKCYPKMNGSFSQVKTSFRVVAEVLVQHAAKHAEQKIVEPRVEPLHLRLDTRVTFQRRGRF